MSSRVSIERNKERFESHTKRVFRKTISLQLASHTEYYY